jgi:hypothetical protein
MLLYFPSIHSDELALTTLLIWFDFKNFVKNLMYNIRNSKFYFLMCKKTEFSYISLADNFIVLLQPSLISRSELTQ